MTRRGLDIQNIRIKKQLKQFTDAQEVLEANFKRDLGTLERSFEHELAKLKDHYKNRICRQRDLVYQLNHTVDELSTAAENAIKEAARHDKRKIKELEAKIEELNKNLGIQNQAQKQLTGLEKAKTFAILDSILFGISNWATDGQTASDVELASQAILFPVVYERVMKGEEDYYIETVPVAAHEVVVRGRKLVKHIRATTEASLLTPEVWKEHGHIIHQWWISDALPLLYGARAEDWDDDTPFMLSSMLAWRDEPASRALDFPLLFDGMELVRRYGDEIRENTGLPEFNKRIVTTRLNPNE